MCSARTENVNSALSEVLMEYYAVPGRFSLMLRQPLIAFQQFDKIILWAQGKVQEEGVARKEELQKASIFFVQRVCFRIENTHYDVLGLEREFSSEALRQRYRALIGLTHPDKNISGLPINAAVRINKAYDILSNEQERDAYDALLTKVSATSQRIFPAPDYSTPTKTSLEKNRFQFLIPNFKNIVFYLLPIFFIFSVIVMITFGGGAGLDLVEKKSSHSKKPYNNSNEILFEAKSPTHTRIIENDPIPVDKIDVAESNTSMFEPLANGYKNVVRSVEPLKDKNIQSDIVQVASPVGMAVSKLDDNSDKFNSGVLKSSSSLLPPALGNQLVVEPTTTLVTANTLRQNKSNNSEASSDAVLTAQPSHLSEARSSLSQLINSLERPYEIDSLQSKMMRQGVSGNLFGVALPQIRDAAIIRVDQFTFNEKLDKNHLVLSGNVAYVLATQAGQHTPYRYAVYAEFKNIDKNAAMSRFELREAK